ncbi:MAG: MATE family efflux transporter [Clostridia bacterium]|nr:MATE family efflux transporter [Clostridia bacterium]
MAASRRVDMTKGPIIRQALVFALPIVLGNVLQQLYSTVDTLVVGNYCGKEALAAVGTSSQPIEIFLCLFMGMSTGVSILVSQYTGSGDTARQQRVVRSAVVCLYLCAIPLTILGFLFGPLLLRLLQVPPEAWEPAVAYVRILFLGTLGNLGYNINAGILRGVGDSRSTLMFLLVSCVVNIVLDLLFVVRFRMDVTGVALATAIAMFASWISSILYIRRKYPELDYAVIPRGMDRAMLSELIRLAFPLGLNQSIYSVGHFVMQMLVNGQGVVFAAACSIAGKVNSIANVAIQALASSCSTFAGQNLGAKRYDRLKRGGYILPLFTGALTLAAGLLVTWQAEPILRLFNDDPAVIEMALRYVRVVLPFCSAYATFNCIISFVNGMGLLKYPTAVNLIVLWGVRIPLAVIITLFFDGTWVMAAIPASFLAGLAAMLCFFFSHRWKEIRLLAGAGMSA